MVRLAHEIGFRMIDTFFMIPGREQPRIVIEAKAYERGEIDMIYTRETLPQLRALSLEVLGLT